MFDDDMPKTVPTDHVVGCDLSTLSIDELQKRIGLLREEISRLEKAVDDKKGSMSDAESFFKK